MPWDRQNFPVAMRNLEPEVRDKAIEIANALLRGGCEEGGAIRIAIARARERMHLDNLLSAQHPGGPDT
jgi:uncharacterized protein YdaT